MTKPANSTKAGGVDNNYVFSDAEVKKIYLPYPRFPLIKPKCFGLPVCCPGVLDEKIGHMSGCKACTDSPFDFSRSSLPKLGR